MFLEGPELVNPEKLIPYTQLTFPSIDETRPQRNDDTQPRFNYYNIYIKIHRQPLSKKLIAFLPRVFN